MKNKQFTEAQIAFALRQAERCPSRGVPYSSAARRMRSTR
jgi:hypothetical protein